MLRLLSTVLRWLFSKSALIVVVWAVVILLTAVFLAGRHYLNQMPEEKRRLIAEAEEREKVLAGLSEELSAFEKTARGQLTQVERAARNAKLEFEEKVETVQELNDKLRNFETYWAKATGFVKRLLGNDPERARRKIAAELRQAQLEQKNLKAALESADSARENVNAKSEAQRTKLVLKKELAANDLKAVQARIVELDKNISKWDRRKSAAAHWLKEALGKVGTPLLVITATILIGPLLFKMFLFYAIAPMARAARPVMIASPAREPIRVSDSAVAQEIILNPGETAVIQHQFYQASDEDLNKKTQFVFDWRYPLTSLACWLVLLTRVTNTSRDHRRRLTLSSQEEAQVEMAVVDVPVNGSLVCRPSYLAGYVRPEGRGRRIKSHWRVFSLHAWITLQFRYFEFMGPARLVLWAHRGVRAERLTDENVVQGNERRTNQLATIGFTPSLSYRSKRAETFISFLRGQNPLFDDVFFGRGVFLCQQISRAEHLKRSGKFWEKLWNGVTKIFGI